MPSLRRSKRAEPTRRSKRSPPASEVTLPSARKMALNATPHARRAVGSWRITAYRQTFDAVMR